MRKRCPCPLRPFSRVLHISDQVRLGLWLVKRASYFIDPAPRQSRYGCRSVDRQGIQDREPPQSVRSIQSDEPGWQHDLWIRSVQWSPDFDARRTAGRHLRFMALPPPFIQRREISVRNVLDSRREVIATKRKLLMRGEPKFHCDLPIWASRRPYRGPWLRRRCGRSA